MVVCGHGSWLWGHGAPRFVALDGLIVRSFLHMAFMSFGGLNKLTQRQKIRCWSVPGLLRNYDSERLFGQHRLMDPIFADFLHDGYGKPTDAIDTTGACCQLDLNP